MTKRTLNANVNLKQNFVYMPDVYLLQLDHSVRLEEIRNSCKSVFPNHSRLGTTRKYDKETDEEGKKRGVSM